MKHGHFRDGSQGDAPNFVQIYLYSRFIYIYYIKILVKIKNLNKSSYRLNSDFILLCKRKLRSRYAEVRTVEDGRVKDARRIANAKGRKL